MEIDNFLLNTIRTCIHSLVFLSFLPTKSVYTKEISIFGLNHMFLGVVSRKFAKINKVGSLGNQVYDSCPVLLECIVEVGINTTYILTSELVGDFVES